MTGSTVERLIYQELSRIREEVGIERYTTGRFDEARALFERVATSRDLEEFLTLPAYEKLD